MPVQGSSELSLTYKSVLPRMHTIATTQHTIHQYPVLSRPFHRSTRERLVPTAHLKSSFNSHQIALFVT